MKSLETWGAFSWTMLGGWYIYEFWQLSEALKLAKDPRYPPSWPPGGLWASDWESEPEWTLHTDSSPHFLAPPPCLCSCHTFPF